MANFNQKGQKVKNQINADNINISKDQNIEDIISTLQRLQGNDKPVEPENDRFKDKKIKKNEK